MRIPRPWPFRRRPARPPPVPTAPPAEVAGMRTLAPRAAYDAAEVDFGEGLPAYSGVVFHSGMQVVERLERVRRRFAWPVRVAASALAGGVSGVVIHVVMPVSLLWWGRRTTDRVYAGDPRLVPPPTPGRYACRLPCGLMMTPSYAVGGVLYLGRRGLRFDPHLRNRRRDREPLVMEPLRDVEIDLVDAPVPSWVWWRKTVPRIRVRWPGGEAFFGVPGAPEVHRRLAGQAAGLKATFTPGPPPAPPVPSDGDPPVSAP